MSAPAIRVPALATALFCASIVCAHEGEDHRERGTTSPVAVEQAATTGAAAERHGSRLALSSSRLELVAVRDGEQLVIYIDDYATNAPLDGLSVEVVAGSLKVPAVAAGEGRYLVPAKLFDPSAPRPLSFLIRGSAADGSSAAVDERLDGVLPPGEISPTNLAVNVNAGVWIPVLAISLIAGPLLALALWRRRRRN
ncbi:MAG: hypothetical protein ACT4QA_15565 [Panacagrimonas sp.]